MNKNLVGLIVVCLVAGGLYWNWQQAKPTLRRGSLMRSWFGLLPISSAALSKGKGFHVVHPLHPQRL